MSKMLANHYFHARDYLHAFQAYEAVLSAHPGHKGIQRRMIICCIETGAIPKAFALFAQLVTEDIDFILNTDPVDDDCPCADLIGMSESSPEGPQSPDDYLKMGMLWLYCDIEKSCSFFGAICTLFPENREFRRVQSLIQAKRDLLINLPVSQRPTERFE